jgi:hypothetical protein
MADGVDMRLHPTVAAFVDTGRSEYLLARASVLRALAHWGIPHRVIDLGSASSEDALARAAGCGVFLVAQEFMGESLTQLLPTLHDWLRAGAGWVSVDHALASYSSAHREALGVVDASAEGSTETLGVCDLSHPVTAGQVPGAEVRFKQPIPSLHGRFEPIDILAVQDDGTPALFTAVHGETRMVQWTVSPKLWHGSFFGLAHGLDGLLWRALVWVAPKPFVMNAMPPFVRYRFDDCNGLWREAEDLAFVHEFTRRDHVPSLCFCLRSMSHACAERAAAFQHSGSIELSPHTLGPAVSIFYGDKEGEYSTDQLRSNFDELDEAERRWNVRWSPILSDHDHEWSANAVTFLRERGMRFKMNITLPGETWTGVHRDWKPPPYGSMNHSLGHLPEPWSDFYVAFNHHPSFESARVYVEDNAFVYHRPGGFGKQKWDFLNGLTDSGGISPKGLRTAAQRLEAHTRIGLDSLFFGGSITHSHFMRYVSRSQWRELLDDVSNRLGTLDQEPASYTEIAQYAEARSGTELGDVHRTARSLRCALRGNSGLELRLSVFNELDGMLARSEHRVPAFDGQTVVKIETQSEGVR